MLKMLRESAAMIQRLSIQRLRRAIGELLVVINALKKRGKASCPALLALKRKPNRKDG
jgi:hypothetical protein